MAVHKVCQGRVGRSAPSQADICLPRTFTYPEMQQWSTSLGSFALSLVTFWGGWWDAEGLGDRCCCLDSPRWYRFEVGLNCPCDHTHSGQLVAWISPAWVQQSIWLVLALQKDYASFLMKGDQICLKDIFFAESCIIGSSAPCFNFFSIIMAGSTPKIQFCACSKKEFKIWQLEHSTSAYLVSGIWYRKKLALVLRTLWAWSSLHHVLCMEERTGMGQL